MTIDLVAVIEVLHHTLMLAVGVGLVGRAAASGDRRALAMAALLAGSVDDVIDLMNHVTGLLSLVVMVSVL
ncbi:MAG: hypothetical protein AAGA99_15455 [Actinomycetota bacterium]